MNVSLTPALEQFVNDKVATGLYNSVSEVIREAINRELARNGQVYYVYNRVQHIDEVALEISKLVPDANVAFAHGQMSER